jgi:hypothetical protein
MSLDCSKVLSSGTIGEVDVTASRADETIVAPRSSLLNVANVVDDAKLSSRTLDDGAMVLLLGRHGLALAW